MSRLFDSHCHLDHQRFARDRDELMAAARQAGVARIATIGCATRPDNTDRALQIARDHPDWIVATTGVHPHEARHLDDAVMDAMRETLRDPLTVAVGEIGLDYHYDHSPRQVQQEAFRRQVALAREVGKPIVVHTRNAPEETLGILREEGAREVGGVIHCFSEDPPFARAALELGFVSSFSGLVTFPRGTEGIREAARTQPLDALLVETDAPFLAPVPHRGKRNEPGHVGHTADAVAELRGEDPDAVREATYANACRLFGIE